MSSYTIQQPESGDTNKPQVCNPPMVYSLAWSPSGRLLAAGLGDGNIPIFSIENRSLVQTGYLPDGHDSSVASVLFPEFGKTNERLVVSGGSDGSILCWDIGPNVMEVSTMEDPKGLFAETFLGDSPNTGDNTMMAVDDLSRKTEELSFGKAKILFGIPHEKKVNWMTTSDESIFIADTSPDITAYKLPLR
jgi:WD40 repeat protein